MTICPDVCVVNKIGELSCAKCGASFELSSDDGIYFSDHLAGWRNA